MITRIVLLAVALSLALVGSAMAQEKKVKPAKVTGDIGLIDTEKNYMIVVTKEGKLVTVDFNPKTKITKYVPHGAKMSDLSLGDDATIMYKRSGDKNLLDSVEVKMKAKRGE